MERLFAGLEAGGTKFVCAVGRGPDDLRAQTRFETTSPDETLGRALEFFQEQAQRYELLALGIAAFGPLDLDTSSPGYGQVTRTPKPGWSGADFVTPLKTGLGLPVGFDTDVNGALLGEGRWGAAQGLSDFIYLTIGTGIGGGIMQNNRIVHGLVHPEMGHFLLHHDWQLDPYPGGCPFHGDCFEGLANGPALQERWGQRAETLPRDHPAWELEAAYIAQALHAYICILSPRRIILGGGVMNQEQLFPLIRHRVLKSLNGYVEHAAILEQIEQYIVPPGLGGQAGVLGALALAEAAYQAA